MAWSGVKRRVFISYFSEDKVEVENFIHEFSIRQEIFTHYAVGVIDNEIIDSKDTDYIMAKIKNDYLKDSTVTIVLIGSCTHSRRFIDWEIKASLQQSKDALPNGLIGIILPSQGQRALLPERFVLNWNQHNIQSYGRYYTYPQSGYELGEKIDDAYHARTIRSQFIKNPQEIMKYNAECKFHKLTH